MRRVISLPVVYNVLNFVDFLTGAAELAVLEEAFDDYIKYTCFKFVPRTAANAGEAYIEIVREKGCWSFVGNYGRPSQKISLGSDNSCLDVSKIKIHKHFVTII